MSSPDVAEDLALPWLSLADDRAERRRERERKGTRGRGGLALKWIRWEERSGQLRTRTGRGQERRTETSLTLWRDSSSRSTLSMNDMLGKWAQNLFGSGQGRGGWGWAGIRGRRGSMLSSQLALGRERRVDRKQI